MDWYSEYENKEGGGIVSATLSVREWTQNEGGEERRQKWRFNIERRKATYSKTKGKRSIGWRALGIV